jgi:glutamyl/glutaminyl-tRNA synthetase
VLITIQKHGWEPDAVLNWLLLCGYGVRHETVVDAGAKPSTNPNKQLDSNKIMDLKEMTELVQRLRHVSLHFIEPFSV